MAAPAHPSLNILYALARFMSPALIIEIGTGPGQSTAAFARALVDCGKGGRLVTVDRWAGEGRNADEAKSKLDSLGLTAEFVTAPSQQYLPALADDSADIVFVDGDHKYAAALMDIRQAARVASRLVIVHDVEQEQVRRALDDSGLAWTRLGLTFAVVSPGHRE